MNNKNIFLPVILSVVLTACGEEKKQQIIIPQVQLDVLHQAKTLEDASSSDLAINR
jgi:predicted component of type VI protein secretion system